MRIGTAAVRLVGFHGSVPVIRFQIGGGFRAEEPVVPLTVGIDVSKTIFQGVSYKNVELKLNDTGADGVRRLKQIRR